MVRRRERAGRSRCRGFLRWLLRFDPKLPMPLLIRIPQILHPSSHILLKRLHFAPLPLHKLPDLLLGLVPRRDDDLRGFPGQRVKEGMRGRKWRREEERVR